MEKKDALNRFEIHAVTLLVNAMSDTQRRAIGHTLALDTFPLEYMVGVPIVIAFKEWNPHREVADKGKTWNTNCEVHFHKGVDGKTNGKITVRLGQRVIQNWLK